MRHYEYRHRVCYEDTNVVGNVYYTNYVRWQGRCREMFLQEHVPELLDELNRGVALATTRVSCTFYQELLLFDEVLVHMSAKAITASRLLMSFQYFRVSPDDTQELVAEGEQEVACVVRGNGQVQARVLPDALRQAVERYIAA
jgi:enediyne core biosynthesis thioesterase